MEEGYFRLKDHDLDLILFLNGLILADKILLFSNGTVVLFINLWGGFLLFIPIQFMFPVFLKNLPFIFICFWFP